MPEFMPRVIEKQIVIEAPPSRVYEFLADIPRHTEWAGDPLKIEKVSEGPIGPGSEFASSGKMGPKDFRDSVKVLELVPDEKISLESDGETGRFVNEFIIQEDGGNTRLTKRTQAVKRSLFAQIISPVFSTFVVPRLVEGDLRRIKERVERSDGEQESAS